MAVLSKLNHLILKPATLTKSLTFPVHVASPLDSATSTVTPPPPHPRPLPLVLINHNRMETKKKIFSTAK